MTLQNRKSLSRQTQSWLRVLLTLCFQSSLKRQIRYIEYNSFYTYTDTHTHTLARNFLFARERREERSAFSPKRASSSSGFHVSKAGFSHKRNVGAHKDSIPNAERQRRFHFLSYFKRVFHASLRLRELRFSVNASFDIIETNEMRSKSFPSLCVRARRDITGAHIS